MVTPPPKTRKINHEKQNIKLIMDLPECPTANFIEECKSELSYPSAPDMEPKE